MSVRAIWPGRARLPGSGKWHIVALLGLLVWLGWDRPTAAVPAPRGTSPTVAVLPFRDLTGGGKFIGEAIRETVTSDLRSISALRVVERGSLDKVLGELHLQVHQQDLDPATAAKIGKLLGANLIVLGAYQKLTPQVRLTARFVRVETSEILGAAKIDGTVHEFLRLQDKVTSALLKSAGFTVHAKQVLDDSPKRPELQSLKTLELYGQAVSASDDNEKQALLKLAVAEDHNFSYAVKDLAELERRIARYQAQQDELFTREVQGLREKIGKTTDRSQVDMLVTLLLTKLFGVRRYHAVVREARAYLAGLPPGAPITVAVEVAGNMLVSSELALSDFDGVLRDGELFLQRAKGASTFQAVKSYMETAIREKREREDGRQAAIRDLGTLSPDAKWDLCLVGAIYKRNKQYPEARRLAEACIRLDEKSRKKALEVIFDSDRFQGKWSAVRKDLAEAEKLDPVFAQKLRTQIASSMPTDDEETR